MVGDNFWNFWWGFSTFHEKLKNLCPVAANPDQITKTDATFGFSAPPKPPNPLHTSSPQQSCIPVNFCFIYSFCDNAKWLWLSWSINEQPAGKFFESHVSRRNGDATRRKQFTIYVICKVIPRFHFILSNHFMVLSAYNIEKLNGKFSCFTFSSKSFGHVFYNYLELRKSCSGHEANSNHVLATTFSRYMHKCYFCSNSIVAKLENLQICNSDFNAE